MSDIFGFEIFFVHSYFPGAIKETNVHFPSVKNDSGTLFMLLDIKFPLVFSFVQLMVYG